MQKLRGAPTAMVTAMNGMSRIVRPMANSRPSCEEGVRRPGQHGRRNEACPSARGCGRGVGGLPWRDETCPVSTEGGTRRVQLVREGGGGGGPAGMGNRLGRRAGAGAEEGPVGGLRWGREVPASSCGTMLPSSRAQSPPTEEPRGPGALSRRCTTGRGAARSRPCRPREQAWGRGNAGAGRRLIVVLLCEDF